MRSLPRPLFALILGVVTASLLAPVVKANIPLEISIAKAPIVPDGTTAGAATDFVLSFRDLNPDAIGRRLRAGATITIVLSDEFVPGAPPPPAANNVIILQGWPQSPPTPPFPWTIDFAGNTITLTLTQEIAPGDFGPGPKQLHLLLLGYTNPMNPGLYPVGLVIRSDPRKEVFFRGTGQVRILPDARPSVEVISLFSGPPGPPPPFFNPFYQTVALGEAARTVGLYLWDAASAPFVGVDVIPTMNPTYYQLAQGGVVVGDVWISAPDGATGFSLSSVALPPGGPPSVQIPAFATGVPVGLLGIQFTLDPSVPGDYEVAISMNGGNEKTLFVTVN